MRRFDQRRVLATLMSLVPVVAAGCSTLSPAPQPVPAPDRTELRSPTAPAAPAAIGRDDRLGALLWARTSAEYLVFAESTYRAASRALVRALADRRESAAIEQVGDFADLPPAVVVDVDETVLDNSRYEASTILAGVRYEKSTWKAWVEQASAPPIPGALEFARQAAAQGVTIYYVTNRDAEEEPATRRNLLAAGFPLEEAFDTVLMRGERPSYASNKTSRRAEIATTHRILLLVGDDLNDFVEGAFAAPAERTAVARANADRWGQSWFLLPNPDYGSWERALYGNERGLADEEILRRKLDWLRPTE